jgi:hypothetical protein
MRTSLILVGFAAVALVGVGAVQVGCSSSSPAPTTTTPPAEAGPTCTALSDASVATTNFGSSEWTCTQKTCPDLAMCAADCTCNNAILTFLGCTVDAGGAMPTQAETLGCFSNAVSTIEGDTNISSSFATGLLGCLEGAGMTCAGFTDAAPAEAGNTEAGSTEAGTEAGSTEAGTEAGSAEAGLDAGIEAAAP